MNGLSTKESISTIEFITTHYVYTFFSLKKKIVQATIRKYNYHANPVGISAPELNKRCTSALQNKIFFFDFNDERIEITKKKKHTADLHIYPGSFIAF